MKVSDYGRVEVALCTECYADEMKKLMSDNPPDWIEDNGDDSVTIRCAEKYNAWVESIPKSPCIMIDNECDFSRENIVCLCPRHITVLAGLIETGVTPPVGQPVYRLRLYGDN